MVAGRETQLLRTLGHAATPNLEDYLRASKAMMRTTKMGELSSGQGGFGEGVAAEAANLSTLVVNDGDRAGSAAAAVGLGY